MSYKILLIIGIFTYSLSEIEGKPQDFDFPLGRYQETDGCQTDLDCKERFPEAVNLKCIDTICYHTIWFPSQHCIPNSNECTPRGKSAEDYRCYAGYCYARPWIETGCQCDCTSENDRYWHTCTPEGECAQTSVSVNDPNPNTGCSRAKRGVLLSYK